MDLNTLKETIQNYFQENTVTVVGSGLSLAEGIPGMRELAAYLMKEMPNSINDPSDLSLWSTISADLATGVGLEAVLLKHAPTRILEKSIRTLTARLISSAEKTILEEILQGKRILRFSEYLNRFNLRNDGITVITPNYDRLIEYACEYNKTRVDTLFIGKYFAHFNPNQSKYMFCNGMTKRNNKQIATFAPRVTLYKPHGCLSWHMIDGEPYSISNSSVEGCLIITPGQNKYSQGYSAPFDIHRAKANEAIDNADRFIIIGYGFNDDHLETHLVRQIEQGKSALILTRSLSDNTERLVKRSKNSIALYSDKTNGTKLLSSSEQCLFTGINLWDLHEMLKEVF